MTSTPDPKAPKLFEDDAALASRGSTDVDSGSGTAVPGNADAAGDGTPAAGPEADGAAEIGEAEGSNRVEASRDSASGQGAPGATEEDAADEPGADTAATGGEGAEPDRKPEDTGAGSADSASPADSEQAVPAAAFEPVPATPTLEQLELAQRALDELAPAGAVGEVRDARQIAEQVVEIRYASNLEAYPDWFWTASLATVDDQRPTILELALLPGENSLLAPQWVPWAERLADYLASKETEDVDGSDDEDDDFEDVDDSPYGDADDELFSPDDSDDVDSDDDEGDDDSGADSDDDDSDDDED